MTGLPEDEQALHCSIEAIVDIGLIHPIHHGAYCGGHSMAVTFVCPGGSQPIDGARKMFFEHCTIPFKPTGTATRVRRPHPHSLFWHRGKFDDWVKR